MDLPTISNVTSSSECSAVCEGVCDSSASEVKIHEPHEVNIAGGSEQYSEITTKQSHVAVTVYPFDEGSLKVTDDFNQDGVATCDQQQRGAISPVGNVPSNVTEGENIRPDFNARPKGYLKASTSLSLLEGGQKPPVKRYKSPFSLRPLSKRWSLNTPSVGSYSLTDVRAFMKINSTKSSDENTSSVIDQRTTVEEKGSHGYVSNVDITKQRTTVVKSISVPAAQESSVTELSYSSEQKVDNSIVSGSVLLSSDNTNSDVIECSVIESDANCQSDVEELPMPNMMTHPMLSQNVTDSTIELETTVVTDNVDSQSDVLNHQTESTINIPEKQVHDIKENELNVKNGNSFFQNLMEQQNNFLMRTSCKQDNSDQNSLIMKDLSGERIEVENESSSIDKHENDSIDKLEKNHRPLVMTSSLLVSKINKSSIWTDIKSNNISNDEQVVEEVVDNLSSKDTVDKSDDKPRDKMETEVKEKEILHGKSESLNKDAPVVNMGRILSATSEISKLSSENSISRSHENIQHKTDFISKASVIGPKVTSGYSSREKYISDEATLTQLSSGKSTSNVESKNALSEPFRSLTSEYSSVDVKSKMKIFEQAPPKNEEVVENSPTSIHKLIQLFNKNPDSSLNSSTGYQKDKSGGNKRRSWRQLADNQKPVILKSSVTSTVKISQTSPSTSNRTFKTSEDGDDNSHTKPFETLKSNQNFESLSTSKENKLDAHKKNNRRQLPKIVPSDDGQSLSLRLVAEDVRRQRKREKELKKQQKLLQNEQSKTSKKTVEQPPLSTPSEPISSYGEKNISTYSTRWKLYERDEAIDECKSVNLTKEICDDIKPASNTNLFDWKEAIERCKSTNILSEFDGNVSDADNSGKSIGRGSLKFDSVHSVDLTVSKSKGRNSASSNLDTKIQESESVTSDSHDPLKRTQSFYKMFSVSPSPFSYNVEKVPSHGQVGSRSSVVTCRQNNFSTDNSSREQTVISSIASTDKYPSTSLSSHERPVASSVDLGANKCPGVLNVTQTVIDAKEFMVNSNATKKGMESPNSMNLTALESELRSDADSYQNDLLISYAPAEQTTGSNSVNKLATFMFENVGVSKTDKGKEGNALIVGSQGNSFTSISSKEEKGEPVVSTTREFDSENEITSLTITNDSSKIIPYDFVSLEDNQDKPKKGVEMEILKSVNEGDVNTNCSEDSSNQKETQNNSTNVELTLEKPKELVITKDDIPVNEVNVEGDNFEDLKNSEGESIKIKSEEWKEKSESLIKVNEKSDKEVKELENDMDREEEQSISTEETKKHKKQEYNAEEKTEKGIEDLKRDISEEDLKKEITEDSKKEITEEDLKKEITQEDLMKEITEEDSKKEIIEDSKKEITEEDLKKEITQEDLKKDITEEDSKKEIIEEDSKKETIEEDSKKETIEEDFNETREEDSKKVITKENLKKEIIEEDSKNETIEEDFKKETREEDSKKEITEEDLKKEITEEDSKKEITEEDSKKEITGEDIKHEITKEDSKKVIIEEDSKKENIEEDSKKEITEEDSNKETIEEDSKEETIEEYFKKETREEDSKKEITEEDSKEEISEEDSKEEISEKDSKKETTEEDSKEEISEDSKEEISEDSKEEISEEDSKEEISEEDIKEDIAEEDLKKEITEEDSKKEISEDSEEEISEEDSKEEITEFDSELIEFKMDAKVENDNNEKSNCISLKDGTSSMQSFNSESFGGSEFPPKALDVIQEENVGSYLLEDKQDEDKHEEEQALSGSSYCNIKNSVPMITVESYDKPITQDSIFSDKFVSVDLVSGSDCKLMNSSQDGDCEVRMDEKEFRQDFSNIPDVLVTASEESLVDSESDKVGVSNGEGTHSHVSQMTQESSHPFLSCSETDDNEVMEFTEQMEVRSTGGSDTIIISTSGVVEDEPKQPVVGDNTRGLFLIAEDSNRPKPPKSPITVHEWVASLPYPGANEGSEGGASWEPSAGQGEGMAPQEEQHDDILKLGAEAHLIVPNKSDMIPPTSDRGACIVAAPVLTTAPTSTTETGEENCKENIEPKVKQTVPSVKVDTADKENENKHKKVTRSKWGSLKNKMGVKEEDKRSPLKTSQLLNAGNPPSALSGKRHLMASLRTKQTSINSDASAMSAVSRSSLDELLTSRQNDAEELLFNLGFGGHSSDEDPIKRIPTRFLEKQSEIQGNDLEAFLKQEQKYTQLLQTNKWVPGLSYQAVRKNSVKNMSPLLSNLLEMYQRQQSVEEEETENSESEEELPENAKKFASLVSILTNKNKFVKRAKSESTIKTMGGASLPDRFRKRGRVMSNFGLTDNDEASKDGQNGRPNKWLSVLNPENRAFLMNEGKKSPETTPKRLIIGSSSFSISKNGDIINETEKSCDYKDDIYATHHSSGVERLTSIDSNSDNSCGNKRSQRHLSVWSMASSITSIDSHEEDLEEQRKLLNMQMSRNRNNRIEEDMDDYHFKEPTVKEKWKAAIDGTLDALLSSRRRGSRTSTPNRTRTMSTGCVGRDFAGTIQEEVFCSSDTDLRMEHDSDVFFESRNFRRRQQALHQTQSFPMTDSKGTLTDIKESTFSLETNDSHLSKIKQRGKLQRQRILDGDVTIENQESIDTVTGERVPSGVTLCDSCSSPLRCSECLVSASQDSGTDMNSGDTDRIHRERVTFINSLKDIIRSNQALLQETDRSTPDNLSLLSIDQISYQNSLDSLPTVPPNDQHSDQQNNQHTSHLQPMPSKQAAEDDWNKLVGLVSHQLELCSRLLQYHHHH